MSRRTTLTATGEARLARIILPSDDRALIEQMAIESFDAAIHDTPTSLLVAGEQATFSRFSSDYDVTVITVNAIPNSVSLAEVRSLLLLQAATFAMSGTTDLARDLLGLQGPSLDIIEEHYGEPRYSGCICTVSRSITVIDHRH